MDYLLTHTYRCHRARGGRQMARAHDTGASTTDYREDWLPWRL